MAGHSSPVIDSTFLASAEPEDMVRALDRKAVSLDRAMAQAVRDRVAALVMADPAAARRLADALHRASSAQKGSDRLVKAIAWRCRAEADMFTGRASDAVGAYEKACREAEAADARGLLGQILVGRVHLLALLGQSALADRLAEKARNLLDAAGDLVYLGKLHMNRGNAFYQQDQYSKALDAYALALEVFDRMRVRDASWAGLLMNQGIVHANLSRVREADALFLRVEKECLHLGLETLRAWAKCNRALMLALMGRYREAMGLIDDAADHFQAQGVKDMAAAALRSRAGMYIELGMPAEAAEAAVQAAADFDSEGMDLDAAIAREVQAMALGDLADAQGAVEIMNGARAVFRSRKSRPRTAGADLHLARLALLEGRCGDSLRLAGSAAKRLEGLGATRSLSEAHRIRAESLLARKRAADAADALSPALKAIRRQPVRERVEIWSLASRIEQVSGRRGRAVACIRRAVAGVEAERDLIPGPEYRARAFEDRVRVYHQMIGLELEARRPDPRRLFTLVEAARARGFHDRALRDAAVSSAHRSEKRARLGSLVQRLEQAEFPGSGLPDTGLIRSLQTAILALEREIAEDVRREAAAGPGDRSLDAAAADPDKVRAALRPKESLVEYFLLVDRLVVFVLTGSRFEMRILPVSVDSACPMTDRVRFLIDSMSLPGSVPGTGARFARQAAESALADLYKALVDPVSDLLPRDGLLTLVPHGALHAVPFECLHDGGDYIDTRYVIRRSPSARHMTAGKRRPGLRSALVAGLVHGGPASVPEEISAVAAALEPLEPEVLRDPTSASLLHAVSRAGMVHLATHGFFREDNPLFSRLSTADGAIFLADLLGSRVRAGLVVLSACASGRTFAGRGDDLAGVAHGFLAAGARTLVAGMWRVSDEATLQVMREFYANYTGHAGGDAATALNRAGREIRREWDHPFYWGGFSVHGT